MSVERDIIFELMKRIDDLEKRVSRLENNSAPCVPIYDSTQFPLEAVEGQVAIAPIV